MPVTRNMDELRADSETLSSICHQMAVAMKLTGVLDAYTAQPQLLAQKMINAYQDMQLKYWSLREERFCPYDCDNCHDDECPCDRLGCAGNPL